MGADKQQNTTVNRDVAKDKLGENASHLRETLQVLDRLTTDAGQLLGALGTTLHNLNSLTGPIKARASALTAAQVNIATAKSTVDELVELTSTSRRVQPILEQGPAKDLDAFLEALQQLERANSYLYHHQGLVTARQALNHAQHVFDRALEQCGVDFASSLAAGARACSPAPGMLARLVKAMPQDSADVGPGLELLPAALIPKLQRMAQLMDEAGYTQAHSSYTTSRATHLQQLLSSLGEETPPLAALQLLSQEQLERAVMSWTQQLRGMALLMVSEKRLAQEVWGPEIGLELYSAVVKGRLAPLLASGRDITEAKRTPEKLFLLLDMHQHMAGLVPLLKALLGGNGTAAMRGLLVECSSLLSTISTSAASLFSDYEDSVAQDASKVLPMDGTIHPLTAQVISYVKRLLGYPNATEVLCGGRSRFSDSGGYETRSATISSMSLGVSRLLMQLTDNLIAKARAYKNEPLADLFLMNNVHYVQWSVEHSGALPLLGKDWLERHKDLVEDYGAQYHELVWMPLVRLLQEEPPTDAGRLKQVLKDTFTSFNAAMERIYTNQSGWTIPDAALRDAVKRVIKDDLLGPYSAFLKRHADVQFTTNPAKYIKYTMQDVASIIDDDLFETKAVSMNKLSLRKEKLDAIS